MTAGRVNSALHPKPGSRLHSLPEPVEDNNSATSKKRSEHTPTISVMRRKLTAILAAFPLAITLTACATTDTGTTTKPVEETTVTQSNDETTVEETIEEPANTNPTFGDTYTWPDGLSITISQPEEFTPSEYMGDIYDLEAGTPIKFTVTATNGTDEDLEAFGIDTQMSSGGKQSEAIFDSEAGIDMPTVTILPGNSLEWNIGFIVADPADMQLSVSDVMNFDSEKVHFTN